jgi:predicted N-formylglutamate amidohydrolase
VARRGIHLLVVFDRLERADRTRLSSARAPTDVLRLNSPYAGRKDVIRSMIYWPAREGEVVHERARDDLAVAGAGG